MTQSPARAIAARTQAAGTLLVLAVALALGALTDLGQAWLPASSASLANSGASWAAVAFVLALLATGPGRAALWGLLGLAGLVGGYYLAAISRHVPESPASIRFWMLAAVIIGPLLGVAASWVRRGSPVAAALGAGAAAGLLGGESVYGLTVIAGSTSSRYWAIQLAVAVVLLVALDTWRVREGAAVVLSVVTAATVGALTALVYIKGLREGGLTAPQRATARRPIRLASPGPCARASGRSYGEVPPRESGGPGGSSPRTAPLYRHGLGPAVDLGAAVPGDRLDRRARQRVVLGEQPGEGLDLVEPAVEQQRQRAVQALDDLAAVQERGRYADRAVRAGHGEQFAVAEQLLHTADGNVETGGDIWQWEPVPHEGVHRGVDLCHASNLPRAGPCETPPVRLISRRGPVRAAGTAPGTGDPSPTRDGRDRRGPERPPLLKWRMWLARPVPG